MYNYAIERGLASEAALEKALTKLLGKPLVGNRKNPTLMRRVLNVIHAQPNDELDREHTDFLVEVESDVCEVIKGRGTKSVQVRLQAKSSVRAAHSFERKCRLHNWGPIQAVPIEDNDTEETILEKAIMAIIQGFNILRRLVNRRKWGYSEGVLRRLAGEEHHRRRHRDREHRCTNFSHTAFAH